ncbi:phosphotransferase [Mobilitalea sibirica]|uniref:Phosphotransferase n=1 Tax=Mobilitalea sibirica TaxID=1462919 RepID=A0A8J7KS68_9FIRM|nr:phosphotransferase [Mobilitalea sibirica]MBH1940011.1 phosphotransferase [Mobilitalea sibirica]
MNHKLHLHEIEELFHTFGIGQVIDTPISITGGLMHKIYRVSTDKNIYAVKWLNPSIMQRDGVIENMLNSERIAATFSNHFPVVAALTFNGQNLLQFGDKYFMVYEWIEGTSIFPPSITKENCYKVGDVLGKMHQLDIAVPGVRKENSEAVTYNWQFYYDKGVQQNASWIDVYTGIIDKLNIWNKSVNDANRQLSEYTVISHRDLDPKNVMWHQGKLYLIDWEAAGYVNPYKELLEVLNYWADRGNGNLDKEKFLALFNAYRINMNTNTVDWDCILDSGYDGMLGWLEYSLKRALGIESTDEKEIKLGMEQITATIEALIYYDNQKQMIRNWFNTL